MMSSIKNMFDDETALSKWAEGRFTATGRYKREVYGNTDWALARAIYSEISEQCREEFRAMQFEIDRLRLALSLEEKRAEEFKNKAIEANLRLLEERESISSGVEYAYLEMKLDNRERRIGKLKVRCQKPEKHFSITSPTAIQKLMSK